ncbi:MAG TPA: flagellar motor switch protein FliN [Dermatophilaceae bacterium]|nr:flagellar motor switch protein FliN [Dermatophilaceae bacterium]
MTPTNPDVENALLAAAGALPGHFSDSADLTIEALTAIQATTLSLPGGAFAVESIVNGHDTIASVVLIITGLVDHAKGEVFTRDEARTLWTAALNEVLVPLGTTVGGFTPGQVHMTDAFDALESADEAQVVGVFRGQTLACLLLSLPAAATGQGAAAALAAAVTATTAEESDRVTEVPTAEAVAAQATAAAGAVTAAAAAAGPVLAPSPLQPLTGPVALSADLRRIDLLRDVMMGVSVELGRARLSVQDILGLTPGSIVELDRPAGAPVDVLVNGKLIAHGEVVVVDEEFAVRISEVISPEHEKRVSA